MSNGDPGSEPLTPEESEYRANALAFIRHASAFVYSEADFARLVEMVHDGLSERVEPRDRPTGQEDS